LLAVVAEYEPHLAIVDIRMPPTFTDEGLLAAVEIRKKNPATAVLLLSQHVETGDALAIVTSGRGFGYLLKDRVLEVDDFLDAVRRVAGGGTALDPEIVQALVTSRSQRAAALDALTVRELEVLRLMAEGRTNAGIARHLWVADRTVEAHVRSILMKLDLPESDSHHRRVLAVLRYIENISTPGDARKA
ncbi:MAG TPA: response regulator transcription factor, partial [Acidimicrobiales bacterium]|nr:response regulator transcription factor [Acidimicrobiales bacterium]